MEDLVLEHGARLRGNDMIKLVADAVFQVADLVEFCEEEDRIEILDCVIKNLQAIRDSAIICDARWREEGEDDAKD